MAIKTPDWVKKAVFYQIFPDRFAKSTRTKHAPGLAFKPWGSPPEDQGYQGGDLYGVVDKLDYLQDLGINAIYLNPIFSSASNHRYHTFDYMQVDPLLGGNAALRELLDESHKRDIKIVLDGVFNHASRGFWAFHHILENGGNSPYIDWFKVHDWPLRPYTSNKKNPPNYDAWWNLPALPKFNIKNPGVRKYLLDVAKYWVEFGIDGWRLDVAAEIDDPPFWREFRKVVKGVNPEAYICGEIWHVAPEWLQGDRFDALMNYPFGGAAINFFAAKTLPENYKGGDMTLNSIDVTVFAERIEAVYASYDWEINFAQMNFFDSHDTARLHWMVGEDRSAMELCILFHMTMPGAPCVYYGNEVGLTGGQEPLSRNAFPWHDEASWDNELLSFYRRAIALRNNHAALQTGVYKQLLAADEVFAFTRELDGNVMVGIFNAADSAKTIDLKLKFSSRNALSAVWGRHADVPPENGMLKNITIPARSALVFKTSD